MTIILENISKKFGRNTLFSNLDYRFELNKIYGIQGHNGSGKSTLLKVILGLESPNSGQLIYNHIEKIEREMIYKYISIQAPYIDFPLNLTLQEFFDFHFSNSKKYNDNFDKLVESSNLPSDVLLSDFSSGMMQKVKLIIAFMTKSFVVLLDEPTEMLDENGRLFFKNMINDYSKDRIVVISSNKSQDFVYCDETLDILEFKIRLL